MAIMPQELISFRGARLTDASAIGALATAVFSSTFGHSVPPSELKAFVTNTYGDAAITADLSSPAKSTIVAHTADGTIAGFALLTRDSAEPCVAHLEADGTIELQRIYVDNEWQGRGVGKVLSSKADELAKAEGRRWMWLGVWEENVAAQKVYERLGYKRVGEHDFAVGSVVQTDWIMLKPL